MGSAGIASDDVRLRPYAPGMDALAHIAPLRERTQANRGGPNCHLIWFDMGNTRSCHWTSRTQEAWGALCLRMHEFPHKTLALATASDCWQTHDQQRGASMRAQFHMAKRTGIGVLDVSQLFRDFDESDFTDAVWVWGHLALTPVCVECLRQLFRLANTAPNADCHIKLPWRQHSLVSPHLPLKSY